MPAPEARKSGSTGSDRPGDRYNARADIQQVTLELLERHGWKHVYSRGGVDYLRRPGKHAPGISASLGFVGPGVLRVHSTSTVFEHKAHSPFSIYGILEHGGDFVAAARALEPPIEIRGVQAAGMSEPPTYRESEPVAWPEPEDRGTATLSELGSVEYVEDLVRPGRIVVWAAEEGSGKSYAVDAELGMRIAVAAVRSRAPGRFFGPGPS